MVIGKSKGEQQTSAERQPDLLGTACGMPLVWQGFQHTEGLSCWLGLIEGYAAAAKCGNTATEHSLLDPSCCGTCSWLTKVVLTMPVR